MFLIYIYKTLHTSNISGSVHIFKLFCITLTADSSSLLQKSLDYLEFILSRKKNVNHGYLIPDFRFDFVKISLYLTEGNSDISTGLVSGLENLIFLTHKFSSVTSIIY